MTRVAQMREAAAKAVEREHPHGLVTPYLAATIRALPDPPKPDLRDLASELEMAFMEEDGYTDREARAAAWRAVAKRVEEIYG